jgi:hypothetical protein
MEMEVMQYNTDMSNSIEFNNQDINKKEEKEFEMSKDSSEIKKNPGISHKELREQKILELNNEYKLLIEENNFESALTSMKKLIFFEPKSIYYIS